MSSAVARKVQNALRWMDGADPVFVSSRKAYDAILEKLGRPCIAAHATVRNEFYDQVVAIISDELRSGKYQRYQIDIRFERPHLISLLDVAARDVVISIVNHVEIEITNCQLRGIDTPNDFAKRASLIIRNSEVKYLEVNGGMEANVSIDNSTIYEMRLWRNSIAFMECTNTSLLSIECPVPGEKNPFCGSVSFSSVFLPRSTRGFPIAGAQPYRNMRFHLASLQNAPATAIFHSAEQAIEREGETWPNRFLSWLYEEFSDYGASPVRPLIWLGLLWMATATLLFSTGVDVGGSADDAVGWQNLLYQQGWAGDLLRGAIVGFQPISWLGSLLSSGPSVPLVPNSFLAQIWLVIDGVLSTVLLALFIFALRRRFRMAS